MIHNIVDLAKEVLDAPLIDDAVRDDRAYESMVASVLFKHTSCGVTFFYGIDCVSVCGYCEGVDRAPPARTLRFPFHREAFWNTVEKADQDGADLWDATHGCPYCFKTVTQMALMALKQEEEEELEVYVPVDPECLVCEGGGQVF